jgi:hypothetical protein
MTGGVVAWILCDKVIDEMVLQCFLAETIPGRRLRFFRAEETDWLLCNADEIVVEYGANCYGDGPRRTEGLRFTVELHEVNDALESLATIEAIALAMSIQFDCRTCCEASRVQLKSSPYYSLLFDKGRVFLADDSLLEQTGDVVKLVELVYAPMPVDPTAFV